MATKLSPRITSNIVAKMTFFRPRRSANIPTVMTVAAKASVLTEAANASMEPKFRSFPADNNAVEAMLGSAH